MEKNRRAGNFYGYSTMLLSSYQNMKKIAGTIAGYCMTDNCEKLRKRFENRNKYMMMLARR